MTGISVDPILGVKAILNAENDKGGKTQHFVSFKNPFTAFNLIQRSGNPEWQRAFGTYHMTQQGSAVYNRLLERREFAPVSGETVNSYINRLHNDGISSGKLDVGSIKAIEYFLASRGLSETDKF